MPEFAEAQALELKAGGWERSPVDKKELREQLTGQIKRTIERSTKVLPSWSTGVPDRNKAVESVRDYLLGEEGELGWKTVCSNELDNLTSVLVDLSTESDSFRRKVLEDVFPKDFKDRKYLSKTLNKILSAKTTQDEVLDKANNLVFKFEIPKEVQLIFYEANQQNQEEEWSPEDLEGKPGSSSLPNTSEAAGPAPGDKQNPPEKYKPPKGEKKREKRAEKEVKEAISKSPLWRKYRRGVAWKAAIAGTILFVLLVPQTRERVAEPTIHFVERPIGMVLKGAQEATFQGFTVTDLEGNLSNRKPGADKEFLVFVVEIGDPEDYYKGPKDKDVIADPELWPDRARDEMERFDSLVNKGDIEPDKVSEWLVSKGYSEQSSSWIERIYQAFKKEEGLEKLSQEELQKFRQFYVKFTGKDWF